MNFTVRSLSDAHKSLLLQSLRAFQNTKSSIEAKTVAVISIAYGLESLEGFNLERSPESGALTFESLEAVLKLDPSFTKQIAEEVWLASFGRPANLSIVPKTEASH